MVNISALFILISIFLGLIWAEEISEELSDCRQACFQKFAKGVRGCGRRRICKDMVIVPPKINNYIPEAYSFLCWNKCEETLGPFPLRITSFSRQGSLVTTDVTWEQAVTNASKQCLVTWEVSGGGLMGNLLTDSSTVELSLWPETTYHVQVTCKNKDTGAMRRSFDLLVDTKKINQRTSSSPIASVTPSFDSTEDLLRMLKDSTRVREDRVAPIVDIPTISSHIPKVVRSEFFSTSTLRLDNNIQRQIIVAVTSSLMLFIVIFGIFVFARRKVAIATTDKEGLIKNEILAESRTLHV